MPPTINPIYTIHQSPLTQCRRNLISTNARAAMVHLSTQPITQHSAPTHYSHHSIHHKLFITLIITIHTHHHTHSSPYTLITIHTHHHNTHHKLFTLTISPTLSPTPSHHTMVSFHMLIM